jgi:hypothetical protein
MTAAVAGVGMSGVFLSHLKDVVSYSGMVFSTAWPGLLV